MKTSISQLRQMLMTTRPEYAPLCLVGETGIGKSKLVEAVVRERGDVMPRLVPLSIMEPPDFVGPLVNNGGISSYLPPEWLDKAVRSVKDTDKWLWLFLDELNRGTSHTLNAVFSVLEYPRRIGNTPLPKNTVVVAAMNPPNYSGTINMDPAMAAKFRMLYIQPDVNSWIDWAIINNIDERIIGYIKKYQHKLHTVNSDEPDRPHANPRAWEQVSQSLEQTDDEDILKLLISGSIGIGEAEEFMEYLRYAEEMPNPYNVLTGSEDFPDEIDLQYLVSMGIIQHIYNEPHLLIEFFKNSLHWQPELVSGLFWEKIQDSDVLEESPSLVHHKDVFEEWAATFIDIDVGKYI